MLENCPHCKKPLNLTEAQVGKVKEALGRLTAGNFLKLGCPHCQQPIELQPDGSLAQRTVKKAPKSTGTSYEPPTPPDLTWLKAGEFKEKAVVDDIPMVMVLMPDGPARKTVCDAFADLGYRPVIAESSTEAIKDMQFVHYAAVALHSHYEGGSLAASTMHNHMRSLPMSRRRTMFYVLIGPEFHTLYDLHALSHSANLVVNDSEINQVVLILKKAFGEFENLFGPFIETLIDQGKMSGAGWGGVKRFKRSKLDTDALKDLLEGG